MWWNSQWFVECLSYSGLKLSLLQVAPLGGAGDGSSPDTASITHERQTIEIYFFVMQVCKFSWLYRTNKLQKIFYFTEKALKSHEKLKAI